VPVNQTIGQSLRLPPRVPGLDTENALKKLYALTRLRPTLGRELPVVAGLRLVEACGPPIAEENQVATLS